MWLLVLCSVFIFLFLLVRIVKVDSECKALIIFFLLFLWNECALSECKTWLFLVFLLLLSFVTYEFRKKKALLLILLITLSILLFLSVIEGVRFALINENQNQVQLIDTTASKEILKSDNESVAGVRMGDAYKDNFNAIQGCCVYNGKLYQFFNKGYYEVRNAYNMSLEGEGSLNFPVDLHYGSVHFENKIHKGGNMSYLYATDHASAEGNVYVIDFDKQKIIQNYNVVGGTICAYDFAKEMGYLIGKDKETLEIIPFNLVSGEKYKTMNFSFNNRSFETLQTAVFHNGYIYILSGKTGHSLIITKVDVDKQRIVARKDYGFYGEPEGIFFRQDGKIVVTAAVGSWTEGKGTDKYIHSEYVIFDEF